MARKAVLALLPFAFCTACRCREDDGFARRRQEVRASVEDASSRRDSGRTPGLTCQSSYCPGGRPFCGRYRCGGSAAYLAISVVNIELRLAKELWKGFAASDQLARCLIEAVGAVFPESSSRPEVEVDVQLDLQGNGRVVTSGIGLGVSSPKEVLLRGWPQLMPAMAACVQVAATHIRINRESRGEATAATLRVLVGNAEEE